MATDRSTLLWKYLGDIYTQVRALQDEKKALLAAQTRIAEIDVLVADFRTEAQDALTKFNTITGQSLTLADLQKAFRPTP